MPVRDGIWFMENAKLPRRTKVLLVTAHVYRKMINRMFRLGVTGYIIKPFDETGLLRQLETYSQTNHLKTRAAEDKVAPSREDLNRNVPDHGKKVCQGNYSLEPQSVRESAKGQCPSPSVLSTRMSLD